MVSRARMTLPGLPTGANLVKGSDAYFDNVATAATHSNKVVHGDLTQIIQMASTQHAKVEKLLGKLNAAIP